VWASEIARTTQEKPAFENNKDIGSQQKFLVSSGYQMNVLYSPHWWPHDCFSVPTGDQMNIFFLFLLVIRWQWLVIGNHHFSVTTGNMGFLLLFIHFIRSICVQIEGRNSFVNDEVRYIVKCLIISDKQNRKVGVAEMLYTYKYCLLGCDAMPSAKHHFHKLHTIFPNWATLAINMEAAQHDFLVYSSSAPGVMLS
jgi:hypothetical protein